MSVISESLSCWSASLERVCVQHCHRCDMPGACEVVIVPRAKATGSVNAGFEAAARLVTSGFVCVGQPEAARNSLPCRHSVLDYFRYPFCMAQIVTECVAVLVVFHSSILGISLYDNIRLQCMPPGSTVVRTCGACPRLAGSFSILPRG